eukprot:7360139-Prymnesium_polylepis.2
MPPRARPFHTLSAALSRFVAHLRPLGVRSRGLRLRRPAAAGAPALCLPAWCPHGLQSGAGCHLARLRCSSASQGPRPPQPPAPTPHSEPTQAPPQALPVGLRGRGGVWPTESLAPRYEAAHIPARPAQLCSPR